MTAAVIIGYLKARAAESRAVRYGFAGDGGPRFLSAA
jgi:hypothetical protein